MATFWKVTILIEGIHFSPSTMQLWENLWLPGYPPTHPSCFLHLPRKKTFNYPLGRMIFTYFLFTHLPKKQIKSTSTLYFLKPQLPIFKKNGHPIGVSYNQPHLPPLANLQKLPLAFNRGRWIFSKVTSLRSNAVTSSKGTWEVISTAGRRSRWLHPSPTKSYWKW